MRNDLQQNQKEQGKVKKEKNQLWDFPGGPLAKTPHSQCRGPGFNPQSGNQIPHATTKTQHSQINFFFFLRINFTPPESCCFSPPGMLKELANSTRVHFLNLDCLLSGVFGGSRRQAVLHTCFLSVFYIKAHLLREIPLASLYKTATCSVMRTLPSFPSPLCYFIYVFLRL